MSKAARSVLVFGIYLIVIGLGFLIMPNPILGLFGMPATSEVWIRIMAVLLLILAYYYMQAARLEMKDFFRFTVHARAIVLPVFVAFVLLKLAEPTLIGFGVVDLLGAIWTGLALRAE